MNYPLYTSHIPKKGYFSIRLNILQSIKDTEHGVVLVDSFLTSLNKYLHFALEPLNDTEHEVSYLLYKVPNDKIFLFTNNPKAFYEPILQFLSINDIDLEEDQPVLCDESPPDAPQTPSEAS